MGKQNRISELNRDLIEATNELKFLVNSWDSYSFHMRDNPEIMMKILNLEGVLNSLQEHASHIQPIQPIQARITKEEELIEEIMNRVIQGLQSIKEFQRYLENYWKKGKLTKLVNKILQWTDDLNYAKESAETLLINMEHLIQTLHRAETLI